MTNFPLYRINPLRYPGGKRWFAPYLERILDVNSLKPSLFVEPFSGGAGVALHLLHTNRVEAIGLSDSDSLVASFWKAVFGDVDLLLDRIERTPINIETWHHLKNETFKTEQEKAFQCLYLNRTSFSGIIAGKTGPIGGMHQQSRYKIDCRFNKSRIIETLRFLNRSYSERVLFVWNKPWRYTLNQLHKNILTGGLDKNKLFVYLDPPFLEKGAALYRHYFSFNDHLALRDYLSKYDLPWLLSYDDCAQARDLYKKLSHSTLDVLYCCSCATKKGSSAKAKSELVVSNLHTSLSEILPSGKNKRRVSVNTRYGKQLKKSERDALYLPEAMTTSRK